MKIRLGYNITMTHPQYTPMLLMLNIHYSRASHIIVPDHLITNPAVNVAQYRDVFGNWCTRLVAPPGPITFSTDALIYDPGTLDRYEPDAIQHDISELPDECMQFLLGSRYCETDKLMDVAWANFNSAPLGWPKVQAIVDFTHDHINFSYNDARPTRTAWDAYQEQVGVCRDFAHLAITLCRCMNILRATAPATSATSACRRRMRRWISVPGSKSTSAITGTPSMRVTMSAAPPAS